MYLQTWLKYGYFSNFYTNNTRLRIIIFTIKINLNVYKQIMILNGYEINLSTKTISIFNRIYCYREFMKPSLKYIKQTQYLKHLIPLSYLFPGNNQLQSFTFISLFYFNNINANVNLHLIQIQISFIKIFKEEDWEFHTNGLRP